MSENANINEEQKKDLNQMISNLRELIQQNKIDELKARMDEIKKLSQELFKNSQNNASGGSDSSNEQETVVDAEVEE